MPNDAISARIICPYYRRIARGKSSLCAVVCDGLCGGSEIMNLFRTRREMWAWIYGNCATHSYGQCPVAIENELRYEKRKT